MQIHLPDFRQISFYLMVGGQNVLHLVQSWPLHDGVVWRQILNNREPYIKNDYVDLDRKNNITQRYSGGFIEVRQDSTLVF